MTSALRRGFFREMSDRHKPSKLIKNQNTSTINADKLKAKMSETIISSAPPAFSSEYLGDELGSLSSCRSKYATTISKTPMNPARSNQWKLIVIATAIARRSESRVPAPHYNHCLTGSGQSAHETIHARKADPSFVMSLFVCSLKGHIACGQVFACRTRTTKL